MNRHQNEILQLIKDYISCSKYMCGLLKDAYDTKGETLLRAQKTNIIPKEGILSDGCTFSFHGGGCYFKFEGGSIDIDFGPNDRCDGFDAQRLHEFLISSKIDKQKKLSVLSFDLINEILADLLIKKNIKKPSWYPNPHLFYIEENI